MTISTDDEAMLLAEAGGGMDEKGKFFRYDGTKKAYVTTKDQAYTIAVIVGGLPSIITFIYFQTSSSFVRHDIAFSIAASLVMAVPFVWVARLILGVVYGNRLSAIKKGLELEKEYTAIYLNHRDLEKVEKPNKPYGDGRAATPDERRGAGLV